MACGLVCLAPGKSIGAGCDHAGTAIASTMAERHAMPVKPADTNVFRALIWNLAFKRRCPFHEREISGNIWTLGRDRCALLRLRTVVERSVCGDAGAKAPALPRNGECASRSSWWIERWALLRTGQKPGPARRALRRWR